VVRTFYGAQRVRPADAFVAGILNNKADNIMSSGNAVFKYEAIKYLRSEIFFV
jgi:hypothetical protein